MQLTLKWQRIRRVNNGPNNLEGRLCATSHFSFGGSKLFFSLSLIITTYFWPFALCLWRRSWRRCNQYKCCLKHMPFKINWNWSIHCFNTKKIFNSTILFLFYKGCLDCNITLLCVLAMTLFSNAAPLKLLLIIQLTDRTAWQTIPHVNIVFSFWQCVNTRVPAIVCTSEIAC